MGYIVGLLGFGSRHLRGDGTLFRYLRESAYPIYVLHSPAIVLAAHFLVRGWNSIALEFAVILLGAIALSLAVYEFAVRRPRSTVSDSHHHVDALAWKRRRLLKDSCTIVASTPSRDQALF